MLRRVHIPRWLRNKYVLTPVLFLFWMAFFNDVDLFFIYESRKELNDMKEQVDYFTKENALTREALHDLSTNDKTLEKFAREQYFMKKPNEDLFVIRLED
jgi:cell division protein FtsB